MGIEPLVKHSLDLRDSSERRPILPEKNLANNHTPCTSADSNVYPESVTRITIFDLTSLQAVNFPSCQLLLLLYFPRPYLQFSSRLNVQEYNKTKRGYSFFSTLNFEHQCTYIIRISVSENAHKSHKRKKSNSAS